MFGLGTLINMAAILAGGILGRLLGKAIPKRVQDTLYLVCGVATLFIGMGGCLQHMLVVEDGALEQQRLENLVAGTAPGRHFCCSRHS